MNDIWGVNANRIFAAGCCGKAALAVSGDQGRTWQAISVAPGMTTGDFSAIAGFGDGIFLAGSAEQQARTMRFSSDAGGAWQETAVPMRNAITQLRSLEFGRVYGLAGAYVTYTEDRGQSWLEWPRHVGSAQLAFWVLDPGRILSCSTGGAVYTGAGGVFARVTSPAKTDLYAIWGISQDDFWVGGINVIAHTKDGGRSWSAKAIPGSIRSIWGSGPNEVYFAGPSAIYHYHRP